MFFTVINTSAGSVFHRSLLMLDRRVRAVTVEWTGTFWDSSQIPAAGAKASPRRVLWIAVQGETQLWGPDWQETLTTPCDGIWLPEAMLEGAEFKRERFFRVECAHYQRFELRIEASDMGPNAALYQRFKVDQRVLPHLKQLLSHEVTEQQAVDAMMQTLAILARDGVVKPELLATIQSEESPTLQRVWRALSSQFARASLLPSMQNVADDAGVSLRQVGRDLHRLREVLHFRLDTFRSTFLTLRIRLAILLLNSGSMSVRETAARTGYGSTQAMSHAFKVASVEPPEVFAERGREFRRRTSV